MTAATRLMVDRGAVSPERAAQLIAEWRRITDAWAGSATQEQLEGWGMTFAPEHPEWFEK